LMPVRKSPFNEKCTSGRPSPRHKGRDFLACDTKFGMVDVKNIRKKCIILHVCAYERVLTVYAPNFAVKQCSPCPAFLYAVRLEEMPW